MANVWDLGAGDPQTGGGGSEDLASAIAQIYQSALGRAPENDQVVQDWINGTGGDLGAIQQAIYATPEAQAYSQQQTASNATKNATTTGPSLSSTRSSDPATIRAQVAQWASMPGADPSLASDPDYWVNTIIKDGGLGTDNSQYWQDASVGPNAFFNNPGRDSGSTNTGMAQYGDLSGTTPTTFQSNMNAPTFTALPTPAALSSPYVAPTWTGGPPPTPTALTPFTAPTQQDLENSPGYQSMLAAGLLARNRSAAANGSVLNGGTQQALTQYGEDYANTGYANLFGEDLSANNANNATTQQGNANTFQDYMAKYGQFTDAASLGLAGRQENQNEFNTAVGNNQTAFQNNYSQYLNANSTALSDYLTNVTTQRNANNDYWSHLNDLNQTGSNLANSSYKPGVGTA